MKRALGISNRVKSELIQQQQKWYVKPKTTQKPKSEITKLFTEKDPSTSYRFDEEPIFIFDVSKLRDKLLENASDLVKIEGILDSSYLFPRHGSSAFIELLNHLKSRPQLALQLEEYAKGIMISGRVKDVDLAVELFMEVASMGRRTASTYNALMSAYLYNGLDWKCRKLFIEMKKEVVSTIVTYNILTSLYGRLCLVPYMERIFLEIKEANLSPNITTYNNLISGYVTTWQFDKMEWMYAFMEQGPVKPDIKTHLYMLRGYAHWKKVDKMESIYELVKDHVNETDVVLVRTMIAAYCDSSDPHRVRKIEALMKIIPEEDYRDWLHVKLINVYAQENLIEHMQSYINDAFNRNTRVVTKNVMLAIIATFLSCNDVKSSKIYGHVFITKSVEEMEKVLEEMEQSNIDPSKKTFLIMYRAYTDYGHRTKVEQVVGAMFKHGF
ncbi:hypothetical protein MKW92_002453 [Papaver armeniacum]|nr:hypothetical protein MKW92_002453 [Papaver armeniacum]